MTDQNPYSPPQAELDVRIETELASRWARLGGAIIDIIAAMLISWPIIAAAGFAQQLTAAEPNLATDIWILVVGIGVFLAINGYLLATSGQTIGKKIVGTRIVGVEDEQIQPLGRLFLLRYLPFWLIGQVPLVGGLLGLVNALFIFNNDRRCLHDHIAGTKVVKA